jgi:hypothetical protein
VTPKRSPQSDEKSPAAFSRLALGGRRLDVPSI